MLIYRDHIQIDPAYASRLRDSGLDRVDDVLERIGSWVAAWSRTTDTVYIPHPGGGPGFYLKRYYYPTWRKRWRGALRGTLLGINRAAAEAGALRTLAASGVPAVRPVAVGRRRGMALLRACFLITEEVPGAVNLTTFAQEMADSGRELPISQRRRFAENLAREVAAMHAEGRSHGQLFWRNTLVRRGVDSEPEFFFLDAQPIRRIERVGPGPAWWLRELSQIAISAAPFIRRSDWCRFLRRYFNTKRFTPAMKRQIQQLDELSRQHRRHETQRIKMNRLFYEWNQTLSREHEERARVEAGGS